MSSIEAALAAIESLEYGEKINYTKIAQEYSVVRSTLTRRHQGLSTTRSDKIAQDRALHVHQEEALLRYIERLTLQGLPPSRPMILRFASQIAKKELGVHWVDRYIKRYGEYLVSHWTTGIDQQRH